MIKRIILVLIAVLVTAISLGACSFTGDNLTDPSFQTLRYAGGVGEGSEFKECVDGGSKMVGDDTYYPYPTSQREDVWDSDNYQQGSNSADHPDLELTDRDGRVVHVKMKISFFLNTSCEPVTVNGRKYEGGTLQAFHEKIGKTRKAYFNEDGSYGDGWLWAMDNYISSSATDYMSKNAKNFGAEEMYQDVSIADELQSGLDEALPGLVDAGMETDLSFYKDYTVKIYKITPEQEYLDLLKERENAKIKAETAQENAKARVAEADANAEVAEAEARVRQAEIKGYGGIEGYLKNKAIERGINPYQPSGSLMVDGQ